MRIKSPLINWCGKGLQGTLTLQSLLFWISLLFSFADFPCFFGLFSFDSKDFRHSAKRRTLAFFGVSLAFFKNLENVKFQSF